MIKKLQITDLSKSGIPSLALRIATIVTTTATSILLARMLGPDSFGIYSFAMALVAIAGLPVQLGVPILVLRETAKNAAVNNWGRLRGLWVWSIRRIAIGSLITLPLLALGGWLFNGIVVPDGGLVVLWYSLAIIPLIGVAQVRGAALRGLHRPILGQLPETLVRPTVVMIILLVLLSNDIAIDAEQAMLINVIAALLAFIIGTILLTCATPKAVFSSAADIDKKAMWAKAVLPLALITGMQILMQNVNIVIMGYWRTPAEIGLFRIAVAASGLTLLGLTVINIVLAPTYAKLHANMELSELARTAHSSALISVMSALPIAIFLILFGPWIIDLLYGADYADAYPPMTVLIAAYLINSYFGPCGNILNMTGHERDAAHAVVIAMLSSTALNLVLIPFWGGLGAAFSTLLATMIWNTLMDQAVRRHFGFTSSAFGFFIEKPSPSGNG